MDTIIYDGNDFTIDKIVFFSQVSKEIENGIFHVASANYKLKQSDKKFAKSIKEKLKSGRDSLSKLKTQIISMQEII